MQVVIETSAAGRNPAVGAALDAPAAPPSRFVDYKVIRRNGAVVGF